MDGRAVTSYTRWVDAVQVRGSETPEVYLTFSPRFEHICLESKRRLLEYLTQKPAAIGLRSQYAIRLYAWAKNHTSVRSKRTGFRNHRAIRLEETRDWVCVQIVMFLREARS
jgi:hypothetical protein